MKPRIRKRSSLFQRCLQIIGVLVLAWTAIEVLYVRTAIVREAAKEPPRLGKEKVFIASIHWNNEAILRSHWNQAVVDLAKEIGRENVYVSIQESGSFDDSKAALRQLDTQLHEAGISRKIILDNTTHFDEVSRTPAEAEPGWIRTPRGQVELRRIPYLAKLRNLAMKPLYVLEKAGLKFDKILFLNDVVFNNRDVRNLLSTRDGEYAAACSLDFKHGSSFYDTFALRDAEGHDQLTQRWPFFRARTSRHAIKSSLPVPVTSCWNGIVAMDAGPFYSSKPLSFRGIPDSLSLSHLEGSECCLIHADNPLSHTKGVWLNPNVRVGYSGPAYEAVHSLSTSPWLSSYEIALGAWTNRILRWITTPYFKEQVVKGRVGMWRKKAEGNEEKGVFCLINEMQVLIWNGWAHV
ncbi:hypothetical protein PRZ48_003627 [Zasmidium cellare]|uniref:Polysaccharide export protein n=1 Tax=Zasmidium cellare TaxID=395010 RepID=A0ABR0EVM1_ZASCE|nr:hypothetical protein PRZ48_003627 [Zasmidium cellare]